MGFMKVLDADFIFSAFVELMGFMKVLYAVFIFSAFVSAIVELHLALL